MRITVTKRDSDGNTLYYFPYLPLDMRYHISFRRLVTVSKRNCIQRPLHPTAVRLLKYRFATNGAKEKKTSTGAMSQQYRGKRKERLCHLILGVIVDVHVFDQPIV